MAIADLPPVNPYGLRPKVDLPAPKKEPLPRPRWKEGIKSAVVLSLAVSALIGIVFGALSYQPYRSPPFPFLCFLFSVVGFCTVGIVLLAAGLLAFVPAKPTAFVPTLVHAFFTYITNWFIAAVVVAMIDALRRQCGAGSEVVYLLGVPVAMATFLGWCAYIHRLLRQRLSDESATDGLA